MNLSEMRTRVRRDLHDEDPASYRWTDAELDRHIEHAVRDLSAAAPLQTATILTTTAGSRELSLAGLAGLVQVEAVEYPTGQHPPHFVRFSLWGDTLTLLVPQPPADGQQVKVYYGKMHTLDATSSTIPVAQEEVVALGAEGYAALEWASFATNRVNAGGPNTWHHYLSWGQEQLARFHQRLAKLGRRASLRVRRLYLPDQEPASQAEVQGP